MRLVAFIIIELTAENAKKPGPFIIWLIGEMTFLKELCNARLHKPR